MIKVENLTKTFDGLKALDAVSLNVQKGSVYGLLGPNGAGKTTLIKHLAGIYKADSGSVLIDDSTVMENPKTKSEVIYIGDELFFFPSYTIDDMAKFYKATYPNWDSERYENLKKVFNIDTKRKVRRLSKGMQKQVAFWLGMCTLPKVMILDEPVDGLDPVMRRNVWKIILQDVAQRDTTVMISSHNLRELEDVCDHVGIMHKGRLVLEKSLYDLKGNIRKIQVAFEDGIPEDIKNDESVIHIESTGRVHMLIVRGSSIEEKVNGANPLLYDVIPLTLEEVFIYELGGIGYEFKDIII